MLFLTRPTGWTQEKLPLNLNNQQFCLSCSFSIKWYKQNTGRSSQMALYRIQMIGFGSFSMTLCPNPLSVSTSDSNWSLTWLLRKAEDILYSRLWNSTTSQWFRQFCRLFLLNNILFNSIKQIKRWQCAMKKLHRSSSFKHYLCNYYLIYIQFWLHTTVITSTCRRKCVISLQRKHPIIYKIIILHVLMQTIIIPAQNVYFRIPDFVLENIWPGANTAFNTSTF